MPSHSAPALSIASLALPLLLSALSGCETEATGGLRFEDQCQGAACDGGVRVDAAVLPGDAATAPDGAQPDGAQPDSTRPDSSEPDSARADAARPDLWTTDARTADSRTTDARTTDSLTTDVQTTDSRTTDSRTTDLASAIPDVAGEDLFDPCDGVFCGDNGYCELGACVCDNGSMGHPDNGCPPYPPASFSLFDLNASSATYNQERSLAGELGKVIVVFYVSYT